MKIFKTLFNSNIRKICFLFFFILIIILPFSVYSQETKGNTESEEQGWLSWLFWNFTTPGLALQGLGKITGGPIKLGIGYVLAMISYVLAFLNYYLAKLGVVFLNFVLNLTAYPGFSYTHNSVVKIGLDVTTSFVNMILVLALVFIALATILRIEKYSAQKLLATFIIVALLINFANVITGLVIDGTNIITTYLLGVSKTQANSTIIKNLWDKSVCSNGPEANGWGINSPIETILKKGFIACSLLNLSFLMIFITYLIFGFIFILRIIVLWILVILAPVAFACYVLPITKKFWEMWKNYFIQWTFIGVFAAFFVYLANQTSLSIGNLLGTDALAGKETEGANFGATILAGFIPIIIYLAALFFTFTTSLTAAKIIGGPTGLKKIGKGAAIATGARWTARRIAASQPYQKTMQFLTEAKGEKIKEWSRNIKGNRFKKFGAKALAYGITGVATPLTWTTRKIGKTGLKYRANIEDQIEERMKEFEKLGDIDAIAKTTTGLNEFDHIGKIAGARVLAKKKGGKGLSKLPSRQIRKIVKLTAKYNPTKLGDIIKVKPELILDSEIGNIAKKALSIDEKLSDQDAMKELVPKLKPSDIENITEDSYDITDPKINTEERKKRYIFLRAFLEKANKSQAEKFLTEGGLKTAQSIEILLKREANKKNTKPIQFLEKELKNPRLAKFFKSPSAAGLINLK